ncbi:MAG: TolC family protein [Pyrinomonadaceae bacterium]|nr:TolC family protein [Pyrinomonadaceae bacterium]
MNEQLSFKFNFILSGLSLVLSAFLISGEARAQTVVVAPTATPTPMIENKDNLPTVENKPTDAQQVQPENLSGVPAIAPNYQSNDKTLPELGRVGVDMMAQRPLTLREAITLALENNKDIEVTRQNVRGAEFDLQAARGFYEPHFTGQTYYEHAKVPVFSFFGGGSDGSLTTSGLVGNVGLDGNIRQTGGRFAVQTDSSRGATNNVFSAVNPTYTQNLRFQFTQPLLRGRKFDQNRRTIEIAKRNLSLTDTQFRQRSIEVIASVQRAYWDLTYALRNLQVQRDSVKDAKDQLEHNRRLVEEGQLAPIDIVAAETQVANFEQAVYDALNTVGQAENTLKNLIAQNKDDALWSEAITPVDPVDLDAPNTTLNEALQAALANRPELELNRTQKDINAIDQKFFREQTKPQIDLIANYTLTGAAGTFNSGAVNPIGSTNTTQTLNTVIGRVNTLYAQVNPSLPPIPIIPATPAPRLPDNLIGGYGAALGNLLANRYPTYRVGVQFNLPLFGDKTTKAQLGKSLVEGEKIKTQREQIEQNIQVDVRNALQFVRTAEARLRSAAIARENSVKQYESEQRKFDEGQTDIYKVLERQTALTVARSSELRAQTELNKSIADLQRATGNSLKANNVEARLRK